MRFRIYIYVDGYDLWEVAETIKDRIAEYTVNKDQRIELIDDRYPKTEDMGEEDLPDSNLGVNFELDQLKSIEIEELMNFFRNLAVDIDREFAVGYYNNDTDLNEDIGFIEKNRPTDDIVKILGSMR